MKYIKHIAGEYDPETKLQICTLCGEVIIDNNNAFFMDGDPMTRTYAPGEVFKDGKSSTKHIGDEDTFKLCTNG